MDVFPEHWSLEALRIGTRIRQLLQPESDERDAALFARFKADIAAAAQSPRYRERDSVPMVGPWTRRIPRRLLPQERAHLAVTLRAVRDDAEAVDVLEGK